MVVRAGDERSAAVQSVAQSRGRALLSHPDAAFRIERRCRDNSNEVALDLVGPDERKLPVLANAAERRSSDGGGQFTRITLFQAADRRRYERDLVDAKNAADRARRELEELNRTLEERIDAGIAERLQLEQGLLAEKEVARLREQFVAILGQDLRNPLASIAGGINILSPEPQSDKARRVLAMMSQSTGDAGSLLFFYKGASKERPSQAMTTLGILESVTFASSTRELMQLTGGRSVYSEQQLEHWQATTTRPVKVINYLLAAYIDPEIGLDELRNLGIVNGNPQQSIYEIRTDILPRLLRRANLEFEI